MRSPGAALDALWARLFLPQERGPEVIKWIDFGRRILLAVAGLVLLVGLGLTVVSTVQLSRLLEESLAARGRTIAMAVARAAFVPLSLEDRASLSALAADSAAQRDVAFVRIEAGGQVWAVHGPRRGPAGPGVLELRSAIRAPEGPRAPVVGEAVVGMDASSIARRRAALVGTSLLVNGLLVLAMLSVGLLFIRNLTLRMRIMVDEARWVAELKRSNRELEEFAYVASHDLQSPLRKVAGFAELLSESQAPKLDAEAREYIGYIVTGTRRMQRLIEDLLTYSRVGSRQLVAAKVDLNEVLAEVLSDLELTVKAAGARVEAGKLPVIQADRVQMGQLFQNLVSNALKFRGDAAPVVRVGARRQGEGWLLHVADNGIGMEAQYLDQIFKMFRRLHVVGAYSGTGIGLAVVRRIVERHGGRVWAESRPGEGSTFWFTLKDTLSAEPVLAQEADHGD